MNDETRLEGNIGFCYRHSDVETGLRCNRCNRFICPKCAKRIPVGFRCPECIYELEEKYYTGTNTDYLIAVAVALPLSIVAAGLFAFFLNSIFLLGWILSFVLAPIVCGGIAEAVRWAVGKRRSRYLGYVVAVCIILPALSFASLLFFASYSFYVLIAPGMLIFVGASTAAARLR